MTFSVREGVFCGTVSGKSGWVGGYNLMKLLYKQLSVRSAVQYEQFSGPTDKTENRQIPKTTNRKKAISPQI